MYLRLALVFVALPIAVGTSIAFGSGTPAGRALGTLGVLIDAASIVAIFRSLKPLAAAMSEFFGTELRWNEMPNFRLARFGAWCPKRGLEPRHQSPDTASGP